MKRIDECTNMTVLVALLVVGILLVMGFFRNYLPFRWRKISEFFDSLK